MADVYDMYRGCFNVVVGCISTVVFTLVALCVMGILAIIMLVTGWRPPSSPSVATAPAMVSTAPAIVEEASESSAIAPTAGETKPGAGDWRQWQGKMVRGEGVVAEAMHTAGGTVLLLKDASGTPTSDVMVYLADADKNMGTKLKAGDRVSFTGTVNGRKNGVSVLMGGRIGG